MGRVGETGLRLIVPAAILLLVVLGLLVFIHGYAAGTETPPANTAAPTVSPTIAQAGKTETTTNGTWSGSPTGFSYSWFRCAGAGSCVSIPGATGATHLVTRADLGKTLRSLVTATNGGGAGMAISAATEAAVGPVPFWWYSCKEVGGEKGNYSNSACTTEKAGAFEWSKLAESTPVAYTGTGSGAFDFTWTLSGVALHFACTSLATEASIENPASMATGKVTSGAFKFSGCTFVTPPSCTITGGAIATNALLGSAVDSEGGAVKFVPATGETLFTLTLAGCSTGFLNGSHPFTGAISAVDLPAGSALKFTKASTSELKTGGTSATLEGTLAVHTKSGEALKLQEP
jgi:hypothetical protein